MADLTITDIREKFLEATSAGKMFEAKAVMGMASGIVYAGVDRVFVTVFNGQVLEVHNERLPRIPYRKIIIGNDPAQPKLLQVLRFDPVYDVNPTPDVPNHAISHEWWSYDPILIGSEQIIPGLALPIPGTLTVQLYGFTYYLNGVHHINNTVIDLTSSVPAAGAKWGTVQIDEAGAISVVLSAAFDSRELLAYEDIPEADPGKKLLFAVKLYAGQVEIVKTRLDTDIVDLRFTGLASPGSPLPVLDPNRVVVTDPAGVIVEDDGFYFDTIMHLIRHGLARTGTDTPGYIIPSNYAEHQITEGESAQRIQQVFSDVLDNSGSMQVLRGGGPLDDPTHVLQDMVLMKLRTRGVWRDDVGSGPGISPMRSEIRFVAEDDWDEFYQPVRIEFWTTRDVTDNDDPVDEFMAISIDSRGALTNHVRPLNNYVDTKANIEALTDVPEGAQAYATDTNEPGFYNGATWDWGSGGGGGAAGAMGPPGLQGEDGTDGMQGPPGRDGASGLAGATGAAGAMGPAVYLSVDPGEDGAPGAPGNPGQTGATGAAGAPGGTIVLFDHYVDAGNGTTVETDLYSDTLAAGQLSVDGDKIEAKYAGLFVSSGTATRQLKVKFAGTTIFDSGTLTLSVSDAWTLEVLIIRVSATVIRYAVQMTTEGAALSAYTASGEVTGLTLANTNILKITGQAAGAGAATNDIVAKLGTVLYVRLTSPSGSSGYAYNYLINGGFNLAQRQAPATLTTIADKKYGADRFMLTRKTADVQYNRNSAIGESGLNSTYYGLIKKITNTDKFMMLQAVEHINTVPLRGQSLTFEIKMKAGTSKTMRMAIIELASAGTADTLPATLISAWGANSTDPTLGTNLAIVSSAESKSVNTSWQKFSVTKTIPVDCKNVIVAIWTDADFATNETLSIAEAGLYIGSAPTVWSDRLAAAEVVLCERFFEKSYALDTAPAAAGSPAGIVEVFCGAYATTGAGQIEHNWKVVKRITPTVSFYSNTPGATSKFNYYQYAGGVGGEANTNIHSSNQKRVAFYCDPCAGLTVGATVILTGHLWADAEIY